MYSSHSLNYRERFHHNDPNDLFNPPECCVLVNKNFNPRRWPHWRYSGIYFYTAWFFHYSVQTKRELSTAALTEIPPRYRGNFHRTEIESVFQKVSDCCIWKVIFGGESWFYFEKYYLNIFRFNVQEAHR